MTDYTPEQVKEAIAYADGQDPILFDWPNGGIRAWWALEVLAAEVRRLEAGLIAESYRADLAEARNKSFAADYDAQVFRANMAEQRCADLAEALAGCLNEMKQAAKSSYTGADDYHEAILTGDKLLANKEKP